MEFAAFCGYGSAEEGRDDSKYPNRKSEGCTKVEGSTRPLRAGVLLLIVVSLMSSYTQASIGMPSSSADALPNIEAPLMTQTVELDGRVTRSDEWSDTRGTDVSLPCIEGCAQANRRSQHRNDRHRSAG